MEIFKKKMKTVIERLDELLKRTGLNCRAFAMKVGANPQQLYDIQRGKIEKFPVSLAEKISNTFPEYTFTWLMTGEESPSKTPSEDGTFIPRELVQMFSDMAATIRSQQEELRGIRSNQIIK